MYSAAISLNRTPISLVFLGITSGNFQENNYGNGGVGGDSVDADAQDGRGVNNANFATPPDGRNPRMQMYVWNTTNPASDGDLDSGIIIHEYGHGISIRLVGGPSGNTLGGSEQMGEGWSDYFGLVLTMRPGDVGTVGRGVGTFALGQPVTGRGIRPTPYSINRSINDTDYADIGGLRVPHGVGYAFATILWDMTWALVDLEGFDEDIYNGNGGNNIALRLVVEGLKNTANNPGFVSGRDGILQADQDLYNGKYNCLIWKAFAERGVGEDAVENNNGGGNGSTDQTVSFVNPCDGGPGPDGEDCEGDVTVFPYAESFEGDVSWSNTPVGDDIDWISNNGQGTPSEGTGPEAAADGSNFIYVEASSQGVGYPNKKAIVNSPCLDLSSLSTAVFSFQYHMLGSAVGTLTAEARTDNEGDWATLFEASGSQGNDWNAEEINLSNYVGNSSVQLRFVVVTGNSWQGDIAIDDIKIQNSGGGGGPDPDCDALDFNDFELTGFSNQDRPGGIVTLVDEGNGISMTNNTWKYIPFNYTVTGSTVIEFEFSSSIEGEIHAIGFEDDNQLTSSQYFKVHGTQSYGIRNFDDYNGGTKKYVIPVGNFYQGNYDRLVFINDNDATANSHNSTFSNVKVYEGSCGESFAAVDFTKQPAIIGQEDENDSLVTGIIPNPASDSFSIEVKGSVSAITKASIYNILGKKVATISLQEGSNQLSASALSMSTGVYLIKIQNGEQTHTVRKLIIQ